MYRPSDDFPRPSLAQVRHGARVVAIGVLVVAALALLGRLLGVPRLTRPINGWPPMVPTSAVGIAGLALGLLGLVTRRRHWGMVATAIVLVALGVGTAALTADEATRLLWGTPTATLLILGAGGIGLLATLVARRTVAQLWIGVGGFVLIALGITTIFVHMVGILDLTEDRSIIGASLQSALAALLIGGSWILLVWADDSVGVSVPNWLPVATAVAALSATGLLWGALLVRERGEVGRLTSQALDAKLAAFQREIIGVGRMLRQAAAAHDTAAKGRIRSRLMEIRRDVPALEAVAVLDYRGNVIAADPVGTDSASIMHGLDGRARQRILRPDTLSYFPIAGRDQRMAILAPACPEGPCVGAIVGTLSAGNLFLVTRQDLGQLFSFTATGRPTTNNATLSRVLRIGNVTWLIGATPAPITLLRAQSILPEFVLVLGVLVSGLLFVTVRLGETAWRNAHTIERMRLSTALASATEAVWEWDTAAGTLDRSASLWRQLGYVPEQRTGRLAEWLELIHPDDRLRIEAALIGHARGERDAFEEEYRVADAAGEWHELVDRGRAVERDPGGRALRVLGITADVTNARRAERALREVDALTTMGRIAARVAHEINNPLAGIQSAFMLVKDAIPESHPQFHYVGAIEREVGRIATVTRQLYETYRPEPIGATESSVTTVVGDAAAFIGQLNPKVTIRTVLDDVPSVVPLPAALLRQIVYNLVQNAVDASPAGGTVEVTGCQIDGELELDIRDQGTGIPEALRERIFEPFFSTKGVELSGSGMGLGLALVQRSVAAVGGRILIDDAPGGGARLRVRLPITRTGASDGFPPRTHPPRG